MQMETQIDLIQPLPVKRYQTSIQNRNKCLWQFIFEHVYRLVRNYALSERWTGIELAARVIFL